MRRIHPAAAVVLAGAWLAGCAPATQGDVPSDAPRSATGLDAETWDAPDDYSFVLHSRCGERDGLGRYAIVVEGGEVTEVDAPHWARVGREGGRIGFVSDVAGGAPTLPELVAEAAAAEAAGADVAELNTDEDGRPTRLDIDWDEEALDDEACFIVSDYVSPSP